VTVCKPISLHVPTDTECRYVSWPAGSGPLSAVLSCTEKIAPLSVSFLFELVVLHLPWQVDVVVTDYLAVGVQGERLERLQDGGVDRGVLHHSKARGLTTSCQHGQRYLCSTHQLAPGSEVTTGSHHRLPLQHLGTLSCWPKLSAGQHGPKTRTNWAVVMQAAQRQSGLSRRLPAKAVLTCAQLPTSVKVKVACQP